MILVLGLFMLVAAFGVLSWVVVEPGAYKLSAARKRPVEAAEPAGSSVDAFVHRVSGMVDSAIRRGSWAPFTPVELEMAGIKSSVGFVVVAVSSGALFALVMLWTVTGSFLAGLIGAIIVPIAAKAVLANRGTARRTAFDLQLDATLQMIASALRAGHSLPRALDTTSRDAESPTAEELGRIMNESRIGRDIVESMHTTADRMQSEDFHWVAEAVSVQRDTGGNLNEVLDRVGETIRERGALKREVHSLSAEGRMSAVVLAALPIFVGLMMMVVSPEYMAPLLHSSKGFVVLGVCAVLFTIGGIWMRIIVKVKI